MTTAEFSKFAGILIAALSQHHLSGFGIAQLNSITSTSFVCSDCIDHNKLWKILKEMGIPDHLICLLRNLYAGQEATVRTRLSTTDWFQIGKGGHQSSIVSPYLFNLYAEYIMKNAGLGETLVGIKIARRNINSLRYADDTTLMAEKAS